MNRLYLLIGLVYLSSFSGSAATITVTNTNDSGAGSLRDAIASASAGDIIDFNIAGAGPHTITLSSIISITTNSLTINGFSEPGSSVNTTSITSGSALNPTYMITLANAGTVPMAISITGNYNIIKGLVIQNFGDGSGVPSANDVNLGITGDYNQILGCYIGLDRTGVTPGTKSYRGLSINGGGMYNIIGDGTPAGINVISGMANAGAGIFLGGISAATYNTIKGNIIGLQADGASITGTSQTSGIELKHASVVNNTIGGTGSGDANIISGNVTSGILLQTNAGSNTIIGNIIGPCANGTTNVTSNAQVNGIKINSGVSNIIGGSSSVHRNIISANLTYGIYIQTSTSTGNVIKGNYIGLASDGVSLIASSSQDYGIYLETTAPAITIGGTVSGEGNTISGNTNSGIYIANTVGGNSVFGNVIGPKTSGTASLGASNQSYGIQVSSSPGNTVGGTTSADRNTISDNNTTGLYITGSTSTGNTIKGNYIGIATNGISFITSSSQNNGISVSGASSNIIGGTVSGEGNVISGNSSVGIAFPNNGNSNSVLGNIIGPENDGVTYVTSNLQGTGILIGAFTTSSYNNIIGSSSGVKQVISGNESSGVSITGASSSGNTIIGNYIGVASNGSSALTGSANQDYGVFINAALNNTIGGKSGTAGTNPAGNNIGYNTDGIYITGSGATANLIARNEIFSNSNKGINLNSLGNGNKVAPVITTYNTTSVTGNNASTGGVGDSVEVYKNTTGDCQDAYTYLGTVKADASGNWSLTGVSISGGEGVTATARSNSNNNTSELSSTCKSPANMTYISSTVLQNNTDPILQYSLGQEIICIRVYVEGSANALDMDQFNFDTDGGNGTGTEDPSNDISKAEVFYTGTSSTFATTTFFNKKLNPNGAFSISKGGSFLLSEGYNYFWLTYDIAGDANTTYNVDAQLVSFKLEGATKTDMTVSAPSGSRSIDGASIYYAINGGNIDNTTIWSWNLAGGGDNGPSCSCAPNGSGIVVIDTGYTITLNTSRVFDGLVIQQGALMNYSGANRDLRLNNILSTEGTGRFQLDSINVLGNVNLSGSGALTSNKYINVEGDLIITSGITLSPGNNITVGGDLSVNGTIALGTRTLTMEGGDDYEIDGRGTITGSNKVVIGGGNKTIADNTAITIQPTFEIQGAYTVTNTDSVILQGNLTGTSASSTWINDTNSVLVVAGSLLTTGELTAVSPGNIIHYNGLSQTVKTIPYNDLSFSGTGTITMSGNLDIGGDLTITDATLDASLGNNYSINIGGDWTNDGGIFTSRENTVTFDGSGTQILGGTAVTTFYNLHLNASDDMDILQLDNNATITNQLTLTNGGLDLNSNTLSITNSATTAITRSSPSYVKSETNAATNPSKISWTISNVAGNSYIFPFGVSSTEYVPVTITNQQTSASPTISIATRATGSDNLPLATGTNMNSAYGGSASTAVDRWWDISSSVNPLASPGVDITLTYKGAENTLSPAEYKTSAFQIQHWNASSSDWDAPFPESSNGVTSGTGTVFATGVISFSPFIIVSGLAPLPIQLLSFDAMPKNDEVVLKWVTATETNNDYFTIERSLNGISFEPIATLKGAGMSVQKNEYSTIDGKPYSDVSYYRLKQTDYNGQYTYSRIAAVKMAAGRSFVMYPNPLSQTESLSLEFTGLDAEKEISVVIYDLQGRQAYSVINLTDDIGNAVITIDPFENLDAGIYFVTVTSGQLHYKQKLIVK